MGDYPRTLKNGGRVPPSPCYGTPVEISNKTENKRFSQQSAALQNLLFIQNIDIGLDRRRLSIVPAAGGGGRFGLDHITIGPAPQEVAHSSRAQKPAGTLVNPGRLSGLCRSISGQPAG